MKTEPDLGRILRPVACVVCDVSEGRVSVRCGQPGTSTESERRASRVGHLSLRPAGGRRRVSRQACARLGRRRLLLWGRSMRWERPGEDRVGARRPLGGRVSVPAPDRCPSVTLYSISCQCLTAADTVLGARLGWAGGRRTFIEAEARSSGDSSVKKNPNTGEERDWSRRPGGYRRESGRDHPPPPPPPPPPAPAQ